MRTRRGPQYAENSITMTSTHVLPCPPRNLKRRRHQEKGVCNGNSLSLQLPTYYSSEKYAKCSKKQKRNCKGPGKSVMMQRKRKRSIEFEHEIGIVTANKICRNKNKNVHRAIDYFDVLPEDLVLSILCRLSTSAGSPSDIINARLTCKKFNALVQHPWVLARASVRSLSVRAKLWSDSAHQFLKMCAEAGNIEASYILGMIHFYCLENRRTGAAYMAKAAMGSHPSALYSLAIIQFNGSGGSKSDKNLRAGVALCLRAAHLGNIDALRELGHCLQDGYGIRQHVEEGRRLLCKASKLELSSILPHYRKLLALNAVPTSGIIPLALRFGCGIPVLDLHPANRFLVEWSASRAETREKELRACSHMLCGRVETRLHEFRRCSVCGKANYCSRACQELDWKRAHRRECVPPVPEAPPVGDVADHFVADIAAAQD